MEYGKSDVDGTIDKALSVVEQVMYHFRQDVGSGLLVGKELPTADALFQDAEELLQNGDTTEQVIELLRRRYHLSFQNKPNLDESDDSEEQPNACSQSSSGDDRRISTAGTSKMDRNCSLERVQNGFDCEEKKHIVKATNSKSDPSMEELSKVDVDDSALTNDMNDTSSPANHLKVEHLMPEKEMNNRDEIDNHSFNTDYPSPAAENHDVLESINENHKGLGLDVDENEKEGNKNLDLDTVEDEQNTYGGEAINEEGDSSEDAEPTRTEAESLNEDTAASTEKVAASTGAIPKRTGSTTNRIDYLAGGSACVKSNGASLSSGCLESANMDPEDVTPLDISPQPSSSGYKSKNRRKKVMEVVIDSDNESTDSIECLTRRASSSASSSSDVQVVEDTDVVVTGETKSTCGDNVQLQNKPKTSGKMRKAKLLHPMFRNSFRSRAIPDNSRMAVCAQTVEKESLEMAELLPFLLQETIADTIRDHYMCPNRKYVVLSMLITNAESEGWKISQDAYSRLEKLKTKKRLLDDDELDAQPSQKRVPSSEFGGITGASSLTGTPFATSPAKPVDAAPVPAPAGFSITIDSRPGPSVVPPPQLPVKDPFIANPVDTPNELDDFTSDLEGSFGSDLGDTIDQEIDDEYFTIPKELYKPRQVLTPIPQDAERIAWIEEKVELVSTIVQKVPKETIRERVLFCMDNEDIERYIDEILTEQFAKQNQLTIEPVAPNSGANNDAEPQPGPSGYRAPAPSRRFTADHILSSGEEDEEDNTPWSPLLQPSAGTSQAGTSTSAAGASTSAAGASTSAAGASTSAAGASTSAAGASTSAAGASTSAAGAGTSAAGAGTSAVGAESEVSSSVDAAAARPSGSAEPSRDAEVGDEENDNDEWLASHNTMLLDMFPDADPEYLSNRCTELAGDQAKFAALVEELMDKKEYPRMEDYLARKKRRETRQRFIEGMTVPEFLELFEEPHKVFYDTTKLMGPEYRQNARVQLLNDLPFHLSKDIDAVLLRHNYHYLPALRSLKSDKFGRRKTKRKDAPAPCAELDDFFLKELCYSRLEKRIEKYHADRKKARAEALLAAREANLLCECPICCEDEVLEEDMRPCGAEGKQHLFCKTCVKRYAEEQIGQGSLVFRCLEGGSCGAEFPLNVLKSVLKSSVFSNLLKRKQAEEIVAAGITDLETCPFCSFATIMPNKEDKVFNCLNPDCLKDSCRLCKEPSHIPLRCDEVESKTQLSARTYLENQMSEAMVRSCYKCGKRFIKEDGCNKMVCSCGATMCYLCKKPIKGYDHFSDTGRAQHAAALFGQPDAAAPSSSKCPLWSNSLKLHAEEVQKRAEEAKKALDPEVKLKHDPTKDAPQVPHFLRDQPTHQVPRLRAHAGGAIPRNNHLLEEFMMMDMNLQQQQLIQERHLQERHVQERLALERNREFERGPALMVPPHYPYMLLDRPVPYRQLFHNQHAAVAAAAAAGAAIAENQRWFPQQPVVNAGPGRLQPAPAAAGLPHAYEAGAVAGNWLQVQVNLDNRNMHQPRVEVQAGGAGNNQWQIQYNVLPAGRAAAAEQPAAVALPVDQDVMEVDELPGLRAGRPYVLGHRHLDRHQHNYAAAAAAAANVEQPQLVAVPAPAPVPAAAAAAAAAAAHAPDAAAAAPALFDAADRQLREEFDLIFDAEHIPDAGMDELRLDDLFRIEDGGGGEGVAGAAAGGRRPDEAPGRLRLHDMLPGRQPAAPQMHVAELEFAQRRLLRIRTREQQERQNRTFSDLLAGGDHGQEFDNWRRRHRRRRQEQAHRLRLGVEQPVGDASVGTRREQDHDRMRATTMNARPRADPSQRNLQAPEIPHDAAVADVRAAGRGTNEQPAAVAGPSNHNRDPVRPPRQGANQLTGHHRLPHQGRVWLWPHLPEAAEDLTVRERRLNMYTPPPE